MSRNKNNIILIVKELLKPSNTLTIKTQNNRRFLQHSKVFVSHFVKYISPWLVGQSSSRLRSSPLKLCTFIYLSFDFAVLTLLVFFFFFKVHKKQIKCKVRKSRSKNNIKFILKKLLKPPNTIKTQNNRKFLEQGKIFVSHSVKDISPQLNLYM